MFKNVVNRCQSLAEMPNERNRVRKGDSPKRIHRKRGRVCRCITANTRAICVSDTIIRVNRCTPVIVAALIDYWLRTNDHRNNPVIDNNTRRFLFVTYRRVPYTARASTNGQGPYTIDKYNFKAISRLFQGHTKNFKASVLK